MSDRDPWVASDALARRVLDRPFAYGDIDKQMATFWFQLRSDHDRVARMCQETAQALSEVENELERVEAERDALKALLLEARAELTLHGWGDFHYGEQPQDASVVAMIAKIDQLVAGSGDQ